MKAVQNKKHLGQSIGLGLALLAMSIGVCALIMMQSGAWQ
jgi:hypothetical protein